MARIPNFENPGAMLTTSWNQIQGNIRQRARQASSDKVVARRIEEAEIAAAADDIENFRQLSQLRGALDTAFNTGQMRNPIQQAFEQNLALTMTPGNDRENISPFSVGGAQLLVHASNFYKDNPGALSLFENGYKQHAATPLKGLSVFDGKDMSGLDFVNLSMSSEDTKESIEARRLVTMEARKNPALRQAIRAYVGKNPDKVEIGGDSEGEFTIYTGFALDQRKALRTYARQNPLANIEMVQQMADLENRDKMNKLRAASMGMDYVQGLADGVQDESLKITLLNMEPEEAAAIENFIGKDGIIKNQNDFRTFRRLAGSMSNGTAANPSFKSALFLTLAEHSSNSLAEAQSWHSIVQRIPERLVPEMARASALLGDKFNISDAETVTGLAALSDDDFVKNNTSTLMDLAADPTVRSLVSSLEFTTSSEYNAQTDTVEQKQVRRQGIANILRGAAFKPKPEGGFGFDPISRSVAALAAAEKLSRDGSLSGADQVQIERKVYGRDLSAREMARKANNDTTAYADEVTGVFKTLFQSGLPSSFTRSQKTEAPSGTLRTDVRESLPLSERRDPNSSGSSSSVRKDRGTGNMQNPSGGESSAQKLPAVTGLQMDEEQVGNYVLNEYREETFSGEKVEEIRNTTPVISYNQTEVIEMAERGTIALASQPGFRNFLETVQTPEDLELFFEEHRVQFLGQLAQDGAANSVYDVIKAGYALEMRNSQRASELVRGIEYLGKGESGEKFESPRLSINQFDVSIDGESQTLYRVYDKLTNEVQEYTDAESAAAEMNKELADMAIPKPVPGSTTGETLKPLLRLKRLGISVPENVTSFLSGEMDATNQEDGKEEDRKVTGGSQDTVRTEVRAGQLTPTSESGGTARRRRRAESKRQVPIATLNRDLGENERVLYRKLDRIGVADEFDLTNEEGIKKAVEEIHYTSDRLEMAIIDLQALIDNKATGEVAILTSMGSNGTRPYAQQMYNEVVRALSRSEKVYGVRLGESVRSPLTITPVEAALVITAFKAELASHDNVTRLYPDFGI
jgi:hypothetical protein